MDSGRSLLKEGCQPKIVNFVKRAYTPCLIVNIVTFDILSLLLIQDHHLESVIATTKGTQSTENKQAPRCVWACGAPSEQRLKAAS